jgi:hypothetical protein
VLKSSQFINNSIETSYIYDNTSVASLLVLGSLESKVYLIDSLFLDNTGFSRLTNLYVKS